MDNSDGEHVTFIDPKQLNKAKSLRKQQTTREARIAENSDTCFYFYQVVNGENLYLHPLCLQILNYELKLNQEKKASSNEESKGGNSEEELLELPPLIKGKVIEMQAGGLNINGHTTDCEFLGHLPPAASYQLVEIDLATSAPAVSQQAIQNFSKQLAVRQKTRNSKAAKEKKYNDKAVKKNDKKFDTMKS